MLDSVAPPASTPRALPTPLDLPDLGLVADAATLPKRRRGRLIRRRLLVADLVALMLAFLFAELLFGEARAVGVLGAPLEYGIFLLTLPVWIVAAKSYGLYDRDEERVDHSTVDDIVDVFHLVTVGAWVLFVFFRLTSLADPTIPKFTTFWAMAFLLVCVGRVAARSYVRRQIDYLQNTVIVGAGQVGQMVAAKLRRHPEYGLNLVGFVDSHPPALRPEVQDVALLGGPENLPALLKTLDVERVVIAFSAESHEQTLALVRSLVKCDVQIAVVPRLYELVGPSAGFHTVEGVPMIGLTPPELSRSSMRLKRMLDFTLAAVGLLALTPVLALVALLIKLDSRGPVIFMQCRRSVHDGTFRILKFRTMVDGADALKHELAHLNMNGNDGPRLFKIQQDPRVTRVGRVLRKYSLDELPQLFNVLSGKMSLVGPRPLILEEDSLVDDWGRRRLDLKPGMTGLWQVLGGSNIAFEEMLQLDYLYTTTWSLGNDLRLLLRTLPVVFRGAGSY
jgi:exopolysaccharide biosynthesis polyprenyl glycosylphosphotransferase